MSLHRTRLLKFVNFFAIGGTERQFVTLAENLDPRRFDLHLACLRRWGPYLDRAERLGVPIAEYPVKSLYLPESFAHRVRFGRYLRRHRIEIVHTYSFYPNVFALAAARLAGVPVVFASIRDVGAYLTESQKRVQRLVCWMADSVIANAEAVRRWLLTDGYPPERVVVIANGIDIPQFSGRARGRLRQELGLSSETPIVGVVSHLRPLKGIEYFLTAAVSVAARFPDARFVLIGDHLQRQNGVVAREGSYRERLQSYTRELGLEGRVIFAGYRDDVPELLADITVSVLPSLSEGLSNTLLESMAAGVPVVATAVGGTPEAIEDGVHGLLVPPGDPEALARGIVRMLDDRRLLRRLGRAARERVAKRFSVDRMVSDTDALYERTLGAKKRASSRSNARDAVGELSA